MHQSSAKTIHKSQGSTEELLVVEFDDYVREGQVYVAISRGKKLENTRLINLKEKYIKTASAVKEEMARLRRRPYPWSFQFPLDIDSSLKIIFINARSMHLHKDDIAADSNFTHCDIIFCCETRYYPSEVSSLYRINGFSCHRFDDELYQTHSANRPALGMAAYYRNSCKSCKFVNSTNHHIDTISTMITLPDGSNCLLIAVYKQKKSKYISQ